jgi:hypothetical protein
MKTTDNTAKIAELNDLCRTAMGVAGRLVQTAGIASLPPEDQSAIREKVETSMLLPRSTTRTKSATSEPLNTTESAFSRRSTITTPP